MFVSGSPTSSIICFSACTAYPSPDPWLIPSLRTCNPSLSQSCQHLAVTVAPGKHVIQLNCGLVHVFSPVQCQWSMGFPLNVPGRRLCTNFETVHESNCVHFVPSLLVVEAFSHFLLSEHPAARTLCEHSCCLSSCPFISFRFPTLRTRLDSPALLALFQEVVLAGGTIVPVCVFELVFHLVL